MGTFTPPSAQAPTFTGLLGLLSPGAAIPDPESMRIAARAAIDVGAVNPQDSGASVDALAAACSSAIVPSPGPACLSGIPDRATALAVEAPPGAFVATVVFSALDVIDRAASAVLAYEGSPLMECLGPMPPEVRMRLDCAMERPALRPVLRRTASEHLAAEALRVASRLPGATAAVNGDVVWACASATEDGLRSALAWMFLRGPGRIVSQVIVTRGGRRQVMSHGIEPALPKGGASEASPEFALVICPDDMERMGWPRAWGVCRVMEDGADHRFCETLEESLLFAGSLPVVPRREGIPSVTVPFDMEVEAISFLGDAAASVLRQTGWADALSPPGSPPGGFSPVVPPSYGGFAVSIVEHGLEFSVDAGLLETLGWREGDRASLGIDAARRRLAVFVAPSGPELVGTPAGTFETAHAVPLPMEMAGIPSGRRIEPPYELADGCIVFEMSCLASAEVIPQTASLPADKPHVHPEGLRIDVGSLAVGGLVALAVILAAF